MAKIIYDKDIFSKNIEELLSEKKLNRSGLAASIGVSPSTIGRYLKKRVKPDRINIHAIAHHFKVNIPWLLRGVGPKYAIKEETNSVGDSGYREKGPLDECLDMLTEIHTLDRKGFFLIKASLEGVVSALKSKGQKDLKALVDRRRGERRTTSLSVELERRSNDRRRLGEISL